MYFVFKILEFLCNAKFRTAGSRIVLYFIVRWHDRFSVYLFYYSVTFLLINSFVRRIDQSPALLTKEFLDDAIFQRVEGDHCEPSSRPFAMLRTVPKCCHCLGKDFFNGSQFLVHGDAKCLKGSRRRMDSISSAGRNALAREHGT